MEARQLELQVEDDGDDVGDPRRRRLDAEVDADVAVEPVLVARGQPREEEARDGPAQEGEVAEGGDRVQQRRSRHHFAHRHCQHRVSSIKPPGVEAARPVGDRVDHLDPRRAARPGDQVRERNVRDERAPLRVVEQRQRLAEQPQRGRHLLVQHAVEAV